MVRAGGVQLSVWVGWVGGVVVASVTGTFIALTFAYANFETKDRATERLELMSKAIAETKAESRERTEDVRHRLERIEEKLDSIAARR